MPVKMDRTEANSGTRAVDERLQFDIAALEAWMGANVEGFAGPLAVSQFKGGQSNPTYRLDTAARSYVLRRKPPGPLLPGAHAVEREARVMAALGGTGFPVPRIHGLCTDESVIGTAFFVMVSTLPNGFVTAVPCDLTMVRAEHHLMALAPNAEDALAQLQTTLAGKTRDELFQQHS